MAAILGTFFVRDKISLFVYNAAMKPPSGIDQSADNEDDESERKEDKSIEDPSGSKDIIVRFLMREEKRRRQARLLQFKLDRARSQRNEYKDPAKSADDKKHLFRQAFHSTYRLGQAYMHEAEHGNRQLCLTRAIENFGDAAQWALNENDLPRQQLASSKQALALSYLGGKDSIEAVRLADKVLSSPGETANGANAMKYAFAAKTGAFFGLMRWGESFDTAAQGRKYLEAHKAAQSEIDEATMAMGWAALYGGHFEQAREIFEEPLQVPVNKGNEFISNCSFVGQATALMRLAGTESGVAREQLLDRAEQLLAKVVGSANNKQVEMKGIILKEIARLRKH